MNDVKTLEVLRMLADQEKELLKCLTAVRRQMAVINGKKQAFRLYQPPYVKSGFYYAHLFDDNGVQTDARMSCKTTDKEQAALYALEHREAFLKEYFFKKQKNDFYKLLTEYYTEKSELFEKAKKKRGLREKQIKSYKGFIDNYFIPFLQSREITRIEKVSLEVIEDFQLYCQNEKQNGRHSLSAKTINANIGCAVGPIFNQLLKEKSLFLIYKGIGVDGNNETRKTIGIIPIRTTFSILLNDKFWEDRPEKTAIPYLTHKEKHIERYRLYCLLGNLCGLRNAEIYMLRKENITLIGKTHFLNIENSRIDKSGTKTRAGKRLVPLHPFAYNKLIQYINDNDRNDYIFYNGGKSILYNDFNRARTIFALMCGYDDETIKTHNIVFYSFRHFWKSMVNNALNDTNLVEYYMGHSISKTDMNKNYLHLGGIGNPYIEANGQKVIKVIDDYFSNLFQKFIHRENGVETPDYRSTLQEPEIKKIVYTDRAHNKSKNYLIWTIPDPEIIEDVFNDDDIGEDENIIETMNNAL
ncbi:MAG: site-specific integrase [Spirochaetaceae bacterium]|jgi:integrase|nr:site-specific integrase [Spirochaetaceae bacterium]